LKFDNWTRPKPTEIEISVFGKGYGESIIIHVGGDRWIVVDSLRDDQNLPLPLLYLNTLCVDVAKDVKLVAASHWHDDHIRGLSKVVADCHEARFAMPVAMMQDEFMGFVGKYDDGSEVKMSSGVREMSAILETLDSRPNPIEWAMSWRLIHKERGNELPHSYDVTIDCMSPSNADVTEFLRAVKADENVAKKFKQRAPRYSKNDISVAMWITIGPAVILLCADLENRPGATSGWKAVLAANQRPDAKAGVMKISHHGSETGHHDEVWSEMCEPNVIASLTPWTKGRGQLPTAGDIRRIMALTDNGFTTNSSATIASKERMRMVGGVIKDQGAKIRKLETNIGHVRHRIDLASKSPVWSTELIGQASALNKLRSTS
jgi:hypothetical protein